MSDYFEILRSMDPSLRLGEAIEAAEAEVRLRGRQIEQWKEIGRRDERRRILHDLDRYVNDGASIEWVLHIAAGEHRRAEGRGE